MRRRQIGAVLLVIALVLGGAACSNQERPASESEPDQTPETSGVIDESPADEAATPDDRAEDPDDGASVQPGASPDAEAPDEPDSDVPEMDEAPTGEAATPIVTVDMPPADDPLTEDLRTIFEGASGALAGLESYRYTTTFVYAGVDDGEAEEGSIELRGAIAGERQHLQWIDLSTGESFELIRIEEEAWILDEGTWQEVPAMVAEAMSNAVLVLAPAFSWEGLYSGLPSSSARVGAETVNGIPATHYTSTYQEWGTQFGAELVHTQGDVWIADEGYPVKYTFTASGVDEDGEPGTLSWTMELQDVHGDIVIEPPMTGNGG